MIAIIDYGAGNIGSVEKAFKYLGESVILSSDTKEILKADHIVLPGVGSAAEAMGKLRESGLDNAVREAVHNDIPLLGICLGLQMLFDYSEEGKGVDCMGILKGKVTKFPEGKGFKVPHIGWNSIEISDKSRLFRGMNREEYVYFVHSYFLTAEEDVVAAKCHYINDFDAAVEKNNLFATQFHPEKSGETGLAILRNFARI